MKDNEGLFMIKTEVKNTCNYYDPFGMCNIIDCMRCSNSAIKIILGNGMILGDMDYSMKGHEEEKYVIVFYDKIPTREELTSYLLNEESDYKLVRLVDGMLMRRRPRDINKNNFERREYGSRILEGDTWNGKIDVSDKRMARKRSLFRRNR